MYLDTLLEKKLPTIPLEIKEAIAKKDITSTAFDSKNEILENLSLQKEAGYSLISDNNYLVSMYCPMPGVTADMINWWFWWHVQDNKRYQAWYPTSHFENSYNKKDKAYFSAKSLPQFQNNIQYPIESIGGKKAKLKIDFVSAEEFGFSTGSMIKNDIEVIVCGHVGVKGLFMHTEMAHIFKKTNDGLFMFSRFWMGSLMKNALLKKVVLTDSLANGMAEHCCVEYRNLAEFLPALYNEYR